MAWARPMHNRGHVDQAGETLAKIRTASYEDGFGSALVEWLEATEVIDNWRSSHAYPLQALKMTLRNRAKVIDQKALIAQRLKRMSSITAKLRRFENMKLSQMQDLGGCRAVVRGVRHVQQLVSLYEKSLAKNPNERAEFVKKYDYIACPKTDGYRGVHFVYKYRSRAAKHQVYNGLRIEIQLRSRVQHAWATAVETVDMCTKQALKSGIGDESWQRFFALMGSAIAIRERCPPVPNTPGSNDGLVEEIRDLSQRLNIFSVLEGMTAGVELVSEMKKSSTYLLVLDSNKQQTRVQGYTARNLPLATEEYMRIEKENVDNKSIQAVLVSVDSIAALRSAYPSYYLDTREFLNVVTEVIKGK